MKYNKSPHALTAIKEFQDDGYKDSFKMTDEGLRNLNSGRCYTADEIWIEDERRYEGLSNPSDMSILYAVKTSDGRKGTILTSYGPDADAELAHFMIAAAEKKSKE